MFRRDVAVQSTQFSSHVGKIRVSSFVWRWSPSPQRQRSDSAQLHTVCCSPSDQGCVAHFVQLFLHSLQWLPTAGSFRVSYSGKEKIDAEGLHGTRKIKRLWVQIGDYSIRGKSQRLGVHPSERVLIQYMYAPQNKGEKATGQPCNLYLRLLPHPGKSPCPFPRAIPTLTLISITIELHIHRLGILSHSMLLRFIYNLCESVMPFILLLSNSPCMNLS